MTDTGSRKSSAVILSAQAAARAVLDACVNAGAMTSDPADLKLLSVADMGKSSMAWKHAEHLIAASKSPQTRLVAGEPVGPSSSSRKQVMSSILCSVQVID